MIEELLAQLFKSGIPAQDVQVLAPMYRGQAGIDQINSLMQNLINPVEKDQLTLEAPDCQYRQGDRVIHLVNDAEYNVFNGDLGYITDLLPATYTESKQDELNINFDGTKLATSVARVQKIRLAYAMSASTNPAAKRVSRGHPSPLPEAYPPHAPAQSGLHSYYPSQKQTDPTLGKSRPLTTP